MSRVGIISQARMTSTRLPGKVLMQAAGETMLECHLRRLIDTGLEVFVATTTNSTDDPIVEVAKSLGVDSYRGSESDVLSRYAGAALEYGLDTVVRVTSDCPLIDGALVLRGVEVYRSLADPRAYVSNTIDRTYPRGLDFSVFSAEFLHEANRLAEFPFEKEHVTAYMYAGVSPRANIVQIKREPDASDLRLTLDTSADFELLKTLIERFSAADLDAERIIGLLRRNPELANINSAVIQKSIC